MPTAPGALSERAFVDRVGRLTQSELTTFVVALWEARGFSTHLREGDVLADRGGCTVSLSVVSRGRRRRRGVLRGTLGDLWGSGDEPRRDGIDRVVLGGNLRRTAPYVIDAKSLYEIVVYGVDRGAAGELVAEHLGLSFESVPAAPAPSVESSARTRRAVLTTAGALIGVGALWWHAIAGGGRRAQVPAHGTAGDTTTRSDTEAVASVPTVAEEVEPLERDLAPGVTTAGLADAYELARTHARLVSETSYQWDIAYRERLDGEVAIYGTETVRVERPDVFVTTVDHSEVLPPRPSPVDARPSYADGTTRYVRIETDGEIRIHREPVRQDGDRMATRAWTYIDRYLFEYPSQFPSETSAASAGTTLTGHRLYRVRVTAPKPDETSDGPLPRAYRVEAFVDERGFVHSVRSRDERADRVVIVEFVYTNIGSTAVEPPEWIDAATA